MTRRLGPLAALLFCSISSFAYAQDDGGGAFDRQRNVSVRERPRPDYEALGSRVGGFLLFPKVTLGAVYDDNIYARPENDAAGIGEVSDWYFNVRPSLQLVSQWSRHSLTLSADVDYNSYADNSSENYTAYNFAADGRLDVTRDTMITGSARYTDAVEPRTALEATQGLREPLEYDITHLAIGGSHQFNRIRLNGNFERTEINFDSGATVGGVVVPQDFRDDVITTAIVRVDYSVSPDTFVFVRAAWNEHNYEQAPLGLDRDSSGYDVTLGADFDLTNLMRGQVELGYLKQDFDAAVLGSFSGAQVRGRVEYFPTQLTTITFLASRSVQDSSILAAPGYLSTSAGVQVDHELLRNVILTARADYERASYRGIDRKDDRYNFSMGGTYLMNRNVGLSLTYNYLNQESGGVARGFDFDDNRVLGTVTLQY